MEWRQESSWNVIWKTRGVKKRSLKDTAVYLQGGFNERHFPGALWEIKLKLETVSHISPPLLHKVWPFFFKSVSCDSPNFMEVTLNQWSSILMSFLLFSWSGLKALFILSFPKPWGLWLGVSDGFCRAVSLNWPSCWCVGQINITQQPMFLSSLLGQPLLSSSRILLIVSRPPCSRIST